MKKAMKLIMLVIGLWILFMVFAVERHIYG